MTERWVADVMHQAGHFNDAFKRAGELMQPKALKILLLLKAAQHFFGDVAADLLNLHRVSQTCANRGITLQRENLCFLLQTANCRRVNDSPAIAFKNTQDFMFVLQPFRRAETAVPVNFLTEIYFTHALSCAF